MKVLLICLPKLYSLIVIHLKFEVITHRHLRFNTLKPERKKKPSLPHKKHVVYITEINWLLLSGELVAFIR